MPSGKVHRTITIGALPLVCAAAGYAASTLGQQAGWQDGFRAGIACMAGMLATLAVNPDLDLLESSFNSKIRRKFFLLPWWLLWMPYSVAIPHRHPISHWPLIGTIFRLLYLMSILVLVMSLLIASNLIAFEQIIQYWPQRWFVLWATAGMIASDTIHWFVDITS